MLLPDLNEALGAPFSSPVLDLNALGSLWIVHADGFRQQHLLVYYCVNERSNLPLTCFLSAAFLLAACVATRFSISTWVRYRTFADLAVFHWPRVGHEARHLVPDGTVKIGHADKQDGGDTPHAGGDAQNGDRSPG